MKSSVPPCLRGSKRSGRAFTVLEILVAAFIALIVFGIGFTILNGASQARSDAQQRIQAASHARLLFQMLERDLSDAYPGPWTTPYARTNMVSTHADVSGQTIEMTTTGEVTGPTNGLVSVRYYVLTATKNLYRETILTVPPAADAGFIAPAHNASHALLPDVENLAVECYQWDKSTKTMSGPVAPGVATHWNVTVKIKDADGSLRTFQKTFALPEALP